VVHPMVEQGFVATHRLAALGCVPRCLRRALASLLAQAATAMYLLTLVAFQAALDCMRCMGTKSLCAGMPILELYIWHL
jgi:hypothetical protein